ncbi:MAG: hypothetical protein HOO92_06205 [Methylococcaceae bacterium]|nr:hypothetical protein [Methylococcaceae bacterium]
MGEELLIPLSVTDQEEDEFTIITKLPLGATISDPRTAENGLPTRDFKWTPTAGQENRIYSLKFAAKEIRDKKALSSKPVAVKIHVWPAGDHAQVSKLIVSTAKWSAGSLTLKGKVALNKWMLPTEKTEYLASTETISFVAGINGKGINIGTSQQITFDPKGNWTLSPVTLPETPAFSCNVTLQIEGENGAKATKKIAGTPKTCEK